MNEIKTYPNQRTVKINREEIKNDPRRVVRFLPQVTIQVYPACLYVFLM